MPCFTVCLLHVCKIQPPLFLLLRLLLFQLIRRLSTSSSAVTLANGHQGSRPRMPSVASRTKMIQLQRASWTIGRYLVVLSILLGVLVFYRLRTAYERWGYTTYRSPPCRTSSFSYVYTTQLSTLVFLVAFAVIGAPQVGLILRQTAIIWHLDCRKIF